MSNKLFHLLATWFVVCGAISVRSFRVPKDVRELYMKENHTKTIPCEFPKPLEDGTRYFFFWTLNAEEIAFDNNVFRKSYRIPNFSTDYNLDIISTKKINKYGITGLYSCILATEKLGEIFRQNWQLKFASGIKSFHIVEPSSLSVNEGDGVEFKCVVKSEPLARLRWFVGTADDHRYELPLSEVIMEGETTSALIRLNATVHEKTFSCIADIPSLPEEGSKIISSHVRILTPAERITSFALNLKMIEMGTTTAILEWDIPMEQRSIPGMTFMVQHIRHGNSDHRTHYYCGSANPCLVQHLRGGQQYTFWVNGQTIHGQTKPSNFVTGMTEEEKVSTTTEPTSTQVTTEEFQISWTTPPVVLEGNWTEADTKYIIIYKYRNDSTILIIILVTIICVFLYSLFLFWARKFWKWRRR